MHIENHTFMKNGPKKKKRCSPEVWIMRYFLACLNGIVLYLINFVSYNSQIILTQELLDWKENKMDIFINKCIFNFFMVLSLISYLQAAFTKIIEIPQVYNLYKIICIYNRCKIQRSLKNMNIATNVKTGNLTGLVTVTNVMHVF